jgi:hypothetical protein
MATPAHHDRRMREEAPMTTITNTAGRKEQARQQLKAALSAYRQMLDTFVNNQVPGSAAETDRIPS